MSPVELLTVVLGLLIGYGIIAGLMSARSGGSGPEWSHESTAGTHESGEPVGQRTEGLDPEWIRANWHEILGIGPNSSIEVIKSAYRLRAQQYHPDKTEQLGPELKTLAARKMQELNLAYAWATRAQRGR